MSTLIFTKDDVERIGQEIAEFEKLLPGVKYGEDFSVLALTLLGTKQFDSLTLTATMMGLLGVITLKHKEGEKDDEFMNEVKKNSPLREILLQAVYLGYRLGKI
jgi:hypothetical protein